MTTTVLTDEQKAQFVTDIADYGTGFVAPLFAVVESIEQAVLQSEQVQAWKRDAERYELAKQAICENPKSFAAGLMSLPEGVVTSESLDFSFDAAMERKI